jgi:site-specific recombinase XerD
MACTYKVIINKDLRTTKSGMHTLYIRVTLHRAHKYLALDHKIHIDDWSGKDGSWIKSSSIHSFELNSIIKNVLNEIRQFELKQHLFNNPVSLEGIVKFYRLKGRKNLFNDYAKQFVRDLRGKKLNTIKLYNTFLSHLDEFNSQILFSQLNDQLIHSFAKWMQEKKGLAGVTVHKYFKPFRLACRKAIQDGIIEKDPFFNVSISDSVKPTKSKKRVYLEVEEISKLKNCVITEDRQDLIAVRDWWLFCFYAAFYYNDLRQLEWDEVRNSELGYYLVANRFKNENAFIAPIHRFKHATEIIQEQRGRDEILVFPNTITESKYNVKLKELANLAGLTKNLMNKTARHSAIQFWEAQGLGTQHVAKMVGHSRESTTKEYFELSARDINQYVGKFDFSKLDI